MEVLPYDSRSSVIIGSVTHGSIYLYCLTDCFYSSFHASMGNLLAGLDY